jgi:hypothetical protein
MPLRISTAGKRSSFHRVTTGNRTNNKAVMTYSRVVSMYSNMTFIGKLTFMIFKLDG